MLEALVVAVTLVTALALTWTARAQKQAGAVALARYAGARALRHEGAVVVGTDGGVRFTIAVQAVGTGEVRTRVVAAEGSVRGAPFTLALRPRGFVLSSGAPLMARACLDAARRPLELLSIRAGTRVSSDGVEVECSFPGVESDLGLLDAAREAVVSVVRASRRTSAYR